MDCKELRIGNLVLCGGLISVVKRIEQEGILAEMLHTQEEIDINKGIEPIPLTKDWLLKFGFKTDDFKAEFELDTINLDCEYTDEGEWNLFLKGKNIKPVESRNEYRCEYYPKAEIKYVHQLQNLYFALTGEELQYV